MALSSRRKGSTALRREQEDLLRRLALNDEHALASVLGARVGVSDRWELDSKNQALAQLAALVSVGADAASYDWAVTAALAVGATEEQIIGMLLAVAPIVGVARVNSAAAAIADALGDGVGWSERT
jgi:4-carboxymuconolactone decarboxylase